MEECIHTIGDINGTISSLVKVFALHAFHNILCVRAGRLEYLNTNSINEIGDERQKAVERHLFAKLDIFTRYVLISFDINSTAQ